MLLRGCGSATPSRSISNADLGQRVETSDSWIRSRTGIAARRVLGPSESLIDLCASSASSALTMAGWEPDSLDLILLATSTPDDLFGSAPRLQSRLGAHRAVAFDLTAACSGFLFAVITAAQYLRSGAMRRILVVGADQLSRWVDWDDRRSCVLFGDAAGALVMEASPDDRDDLNGFLMRSDGRRGDVLKLPQIDERAPLVGDASHQQGGFQPIQMNGQEVYKFAVREVPGILDELLKQAGLGANSRTGCCCIRPTSASSMLWLNVSPSLQPRCSATWRTTATPQRRRFHSCSMKRCGTDGYRLAIASPAVVLELA